MIAVNLLETPPDEPLVFECKNCNANPVEGEKKCRPR